MTETEIDQLDFHYDGKMNFTVKITFVVIEIIIAILAVSGNLAVIIAFIKEPKLRRQTNYYIISLAGADFLVGAVGIPFGILIVRICQFFAHA